MEALTYKTIAKIAVLLFLYLFLSFFYTGVTSIPTEGDSLAYHIPIAESVFDGSILHPSREGYALGFYPGAAEMILSLFILFQIPLNLYNLLGWVILTYLCFRLGRAYGLKSSLAIIYAVSVTTVISMIRLLNNQTIDIWLADFFTGCILLLRQPKKTLLTFFFLGITFGLLVGSKFSGPLYAIVLLGFFGKDLLRSITVKRGVVFFIPFLFFGCLWYVRNILLTGNPVYPQEIPYLQGNENFHLLSWMGWKTVLFYPNGIFLMAFAIFQEFMLWSFALLLGVYVFVSKDRSANSKEIRSLMGIGLVNSLIFFFLPSTGDNIITYLRYLFPAFIPLILGVYLYLEKRKQLLLILPLIVMNSVFVLSLLPHRPKLLLIFFMIAALFLFGYAKIMKRSKSI